MNMEEMKRLLESIGVNVRYGKKDNHGFTRVLEFNVYNLEYKITWFKNQSTLDIGDHTRCATIPFLYIYHDTTFPLRGGNTSIGFSFTKKPKKQMYDEEYPYEVLRIPLEITKGEEK